MEEEEKEKELSTESSNKAFAEMRVSLRALKLEREKLAEEVKKKEDMLISLANSEKKAQQELLVEKYGRRFNFSEEAMEILKTAKNKDDVDKIAENLKKVATKTSNMTNMTNMNSEKSNTPKWR